MHKIILFIGVVIVVYLIINIFNDKEHFEWQPLQFGPESSNCYKLDNKSCLKYTNCGICNDLCVPGDVNGPYFKGGCDDWTYTNFDNHIFGEKDTSVTPSFDKRYIDYEQWATAPVSMVGDH